MGVFVWEKRKNDHVTSLIHPPGPVRVCVCAHSRTKEWPLGIGAACFGAFLQHRFYLFINCLVLFSKLALLEVFKLVTVLFHFY